MASAAQLKANSKYLKNTDMCTYTIYTYMYTYV